MAHRYASAEWLELSGLPGALNQVRQGGWLLFKKIVELDCRAHRDPDAVECSLGELAERCGVEWEKAARILEALRKKKVLAAFIPDNPDELGLFQIRTPIATPRTPEEVAAGAADPLMRDPTAYRYTRKPADKPAQVKKVQRIIDHYLNTLSQRMNSIIVDEIEMLAQRFPIESIEKTIDRGARHDVRSIGWVARELIRDARRDAPAKPGKR